MLDSPQIPYFSNKTLKKERTESPTTPLGKTRLWSKPPDIDKIAHALTQTADFTREHHRAFSARRDTELSGALSSMRWVSRHHSLPETNTPTRVPCQVQKRSEAQGCFIHQQLLVEHRYRWLAPCRQFR